MSWQEELRRLDEELAAGRISADDYRVRRDEVLSSAVNVGAQEPAPGADQSEATQIVAPVNMPNPGTGPQQPPGGNQAQGADANGVERTQVTQPGWQAQPPTAQSGSERTQVVQGYPPPQQGQGAPGQPGPQSGDFPAQQPGQGQHPGQYWNAPNPDPTPPWGGSEFPPLTAPAQQEWASQGPETFETTSSGSGKKVLVIVSVVLLAAAIGVVGWLLTTSGSDNGDNQANPGPAPQTSAAPTSPAQPQDDLYIAQLPGMATQVEQVETFDDVVTNAYLTDDENRVYMDAEADRSRMFVSTLPSGAEVLVLTTETGSADSAGTAVEDLVALQEEYGMEPYAGTTPEGVEVTQIDKSESNPAAIRAHYAHDKTVVRVQVAAADLDQLGKVFDEIIAAQLQALSADG
ncbi:flagellar basal body protein FliL [Qaidamihabitans albus]|uniref:flagellar basal body protein FliL n=1 Tax=Qaidamihabitans albus TaxID=2795733 RepID=UPI0018F17EDA|nr:flagellar basal body protein FliL [Qaidamihabitans albus]